MRIILTILLITFSLQLKAPAMRFLPIVQAEGINPYSELFNATCFVESSNRAGIINFSEQAYGIVQIRQCRLDDYN